MLPCPPLTLRRRDLHHLAEVHVLDHNLTKRRPCGVPVQMTPHSRRQASATPLPRQSLPGPRLSWEEVSPISRLALSSLTRLTRPQPPWDSRNALPNRLPFRPRFSV
ncbi:hypothetical protein E2C01_075852 [Portunus trituberculatus]|uniref:Uncharacterized protein n=1 Tax=Portunus trituberculatus TaxID=210409 RepID=A0A5B7ILM0_PORTR|nr:hypothetical protein [Portunus trituberculatus]